MSDLAAALAATLGRPVARLAPSADPAATAVLRRYA